MKTIRYLGMRFTRDEKTGYYHNSKLRTRLHRYVYASVHGSIPKGMHIHHADGNKDNNDPSNLQALTAHDHQIHHGQHLTRERRQAARENMLSKVIPAAVKWHQSDAGKAWHLNHYQQMKDRLHKKQEHTCRHCGKSYMAASPGYCSNACKSAYRRAQGTDNIVKVCPVCGQSFSRNRYAKGITCSRSCANRYRGRKCESTK